MCILKGFSPLIAGFDVQDGFLCANRSPLKTIVSRKVISFSDISAVNFIVGWKLLASLIKKFHVFSVTVPKRENVIDAMLPFS